MMFTQHLRPDGRTRPAEIHRGPLVESMVRILENRYGARFEIEVLTTGEISMTCEREGKDGETEVLAAELVPNGPEVPEVVDRMVKRALGAADGKES